MHRAALFHCISRCLSSAGPVFLIGYFCHSRGTQIELLSAAVHMGESQRHPETDRERETCVCVYTCKSLHVCIRMPPRISPNLNHSTPQSTAEQLWQCHKSQLAAATYNNLNVTWNVKQSSTPSAEVFLLFIPPFFSRFIACTDVLSCNLYKLLAVLDDATTKSF